MLARRVLCSLGLAPTACSATAGPASKPPTASSAAPTRELAATGSSPAPQGEALAAPVTEATADAAATGVASGWLGVEVAKREGEPGVLVRSVMHGSPAERAGLADGDVVLSIDGNNVGHPTELRQHVMKAHAGARVSLGVLRGGAARLFAVDLEPMPSDDEVMRRNYVGARAPEFGSLDTVQGSVTPSLPALKGRVVVLEFWASWCGVCHVMAPTLQGWQDRYSAQGLTVLGVTNDPVEVAGRTAGELGVGSGPA